MANLGLNIDHVATVRNARGTLFPDPVKAALIGEDNGADGITAHLREDRRHIRDEDMFRLKSSIRTRLNMEMANTEEMVSIALKLKPYMVTLVPERREELTTEGGLDVVGHLESITRATGQLQDAGIKVSLFIDPDLRQVEASLKAGAPIVEFHTGRYCEAFEAAGGQVPQVELDALIESARQCVAMGIEVNAGHGLNYENVPPILAMPGLWELNIGHSLIAEAVFSGIGPAVKRMKDLIR
jgi:pyridoxine 5-phosphate synthase